MTTTTERDDREKVRCPKCGETSGMDWTQCNGDCPMPMSPHFREKGRTMTLPSEVLLPCPFCNSNEVSQSYSYGPHKNEMNSRFVECENCAALGPPDDACSESEAARLWNRRAGLTALLGLPGTREVVIEVMLVSVSRGDDYSMTADAAIEALRKMIGGSDGQ